MIIYRQIFFKQTQYIYSPKENVCKTTISNKQKKNIHIVYINIKKNEQNDRNERVISAALLSLSSVQVIQTSIIKATSNRKTNIHNSL